MTKKPQKQETKDEPGTEERFLRGVRNIVRTPPKPFTPAKSKKADDKKFRSKKYDGG